MLFLFAFSCTERGVTIPPSRSPSPLVLLGAVNSTISVALMQTSYRDTKTRN